MRIFIGVDFSEEVKEKIQEIQTMVQKWTGVFSYREIFMRKLAYKKSI